MIGCHLFAIGMRDGDRVGDAIVGAAELAGSGRAISVAVHNPARGPVLIGASVRRRPLHLRGEAGQSVTVPRRTLKDPLLAGQHSVVWAIPAGETQTIVVALSPSIRRQAELVVVIGEPDRLRVVRQLVHISAAGPRDLSRHPVGHQPAQGQLRAAHNDADKVPWNGYRLARRPFAPARPGDA
ncbi:MAG TPA: hypothetical protein VE197_18605 [Mycobacterium sp.]|nr:hypothetical protein [Mycobacterium sp.]